MVAATCCQPWRGRTAFAQCHLAVPLSWPQSVPQNLLITAILSNQAFVSVKLYLFRLDDFAVAGAWSLRGASFPAHPSLTIVFIAGFYTADCSSTCILLPSAFAPSQLHYSISHHKGALIFGASYCTWCYFTSLPALKQQASGVQQHQHQLQQKQHQQALQA